MKKDWFYRIGTWVDKYPAQLFRKNRLIREAEDGWDVRLAYYVEKLGEEYITCDTKDISKSTENNRAMGVLREKRRILGGFAIGSCLGLSWMVGDIVKLIANNQEIKPHTIPVYVVVVVCMGGLISFLLHRKLNDRVRKREEDIKRELPGFVTNMILLLQAGVTVFRAFNMSIAAIQGESPLKKAGANVEREVMCGLREEEALERFSDRCRVIEASRLVSVMIQNLRKGGSEISPMLRVVANECWEERKKIARVKGEEASAKLLFPMMLLLLAIVCIVVTPAILTLMQVG